MAKEVLVVGAGFGGLEAARALAREPGVRVTVLDQRNHHLFQPLLYQVATAGLNPADIALPVRAIFQDHDNVEFRLATVERIDLDAHMVHVDIGAPLPYDYLVVAAGSETRWFDVPGVKEHALPLKSVEDAIAVRSHVLAQFDEAKAVYEKLAAEAN